MSQDVVSWRAAQVSTQSLNGKKGGEQNAVSINLNVIMRLQFAFQILVPEGKLERVCMCVQGATGYPARITDGDATMLWGCIL